jgi:hypothetical protein
LQASQTSGEFGLVQERSQREPKLSNRLHSRVGILKLGKWLAHC